MYHSDARTKIKNRNHWLPLNVARAPNYSENSRMTQNLLTAFLVCTVFEINQILMRESSSQKNSFLNAEEIKNHGKKVVGYVLQWLIKP